MHGRVINGTGCSVILLQLRQRLPLDILTALNAPALAAFLRSAGQSHASDMEDADVRHFLFLLELEIRALIGGESHVRFHHISRTCTLHPEQSGGDGDR